MASAPTTEKPVRLVPADATLESITEKISGIVLQKHKRNGWMLGFAFSFLLFNILLISILWVLVKGVGVWGINIPIAWGLAIVNFVWWIGIGHAGTLISAILLLLHQDWRTSINRFAEAMTLFAVACAGLYPLLHLGRWEFFYWLAPYPATTNMWPQFRSPLIWDFFAVSTYATVSVIFWYMGMIPDLATLRDRAKNRYIKMTYGVFALGWRNSARHWKRFQATYLLMAALATPLVVSVHTTVSFDFAVSIVGPWHSTVFPPYFVGGAIYCGFAMVICIAIPLRRVYKLKDVVTAKHLDNMAKVMLAASFVVCYGYLMDFWIAWYKDEPYDSYIYSNRFTGPYGIFYWGLILCNCAIPQLLWIPLFRSNTILLYIIALAVNVGMWLERLIIISVSLTRDYLPSDWTFYKPTFWDWSLYLGTFGLFLTLFFLFVRLLPAISMSEIRELVATSKEDAAHE